MKKIVTTIIIFLLTMPIFGVTIQDRFLSALVRVESGGDSNKIGRFGERGILQIRQCVVNDLNTLIDKKQKWTIVDARDPIKAKTMCRLYLQYWGKKYEKRTGLKATNEVLSKIWNGGPKFDKMKSWRFKRNVQNYWLRVRKYL